MMERLESGRTLVLALACSMLVGVSGACMAAHPVGARWRAAGCATHCQYVSVRLSLSRLMPLPGFALLEDQTARSPISCPSIRAHKPMLLLDGVPQAHCLHAIVLFLLDYMFTASFEPCWMRLLRSARQNIAGKGSCADSSKLQE